MIDRLQALHHWTSYGEISYAQARIKAYLGQKTAAIALLKKSLEEGYRFMPAISFQHDPDLMALHDMPAYQELLRYRWE